MNLSQIYECRTWETEHYMNSVLEITVSFLGIHKGEPAVYIGFPTAFICSVGVKNIRHKSVYRCVLRKGCNRTDVTNPPKSLAHGFNCMWIFCMNIWGLRVLTHKRITIIVRTKMYPSIKDFYKQDVYFLEQNKNLPSNFLEGQKILRNIYFWGQWIKCNQCSHQMWA